MKVRLIDLSGEVIAEAEIQTQAVAVVFSNRVFIHSFRVATFEYYREVEATKIKEIQTLRAETSLTVERKTNDD